MHWLIYWGIYLPDLVHSRAQFAIVLCAMDITVVIYIEIKISLA